jgi:shikimate dehydrogenase
LLRQEHVVFDIVYTPRETRLLREAKSVGCKTIPGLEMFVNQAVVQFELWTGQRAPVEVMRKIVKEYLK